MTRFQHFSVHCHQQQFTLVTVKKCICQTSHHNIFTGRTKLVHVLFKCLVQIQHNDLVPTVSSKRNGVDPCIFVHFQRLCQLPHHCIFCDLIYIDGVLHNIFCALISTVYMEPDALWRLLSFRLHNLFHRRHGLLHLRQKLRARILFPTSDHADTQHRQHHIFFPFFHIGNPPYL